MSLPSTNEKTAWEIAVNKDLVQCWTILTTFLVLVIGVGSFYLTDHLSGHNLYWSVGGLAAGLVVGCLAFRPLYRWLFAKSELLANQLITLGRDDLL